MLFQKMEMNSNTRKELMPVFETEILKLEQLLGLDLGHWRKT